MTRLEAPEGFQPSGRSEAEIRENIRRIPVHTLLSSNFSIEQRDEIRDIWWEEIALAQKDRDEEEAHAMNESM